MVRLHLPSGNGAAQFPWLVWPRSFGLIRRLVFFSSFLFFFFIFVFVLPVVGLQHKNQKKSDGWTALNGALILIESDRLRLSRSLELPKKRSQE
jgi:hypothetical protein